MAKEGDAIDIWGDGSAVRSYTYVDDMVDGIWRLMHSGLEVPVNIGCPNYYSVQDLVEVVATVARKNVGVKTVAGPVGVMSRNFSNEKIYSIGWRAQFDLKDGIAKTYPWIAKQVRKAAKAGELS
jgi:nucleoside-diphosphate-sugar epimerase